MATRAQIRTRARIRADQDKSQFPRDEQYDLIINSCGQTIYHDLIAAGMPVTKVAQTITLVGDEDGVYEINSGEPIHSVTHVYLLNGGQATELSRVDESNIAGMFSTNRGGPPTRYEVTTEIDGPHLKVFPPFATGTVVVRYVPAWPGFTSDTDRWVGPGNSDELLVLMAAAAGCRKEGEVSDARALEEEYRLLWDKVIAQAAWFDQRGLPRIRDVESRKWPVDPFDFEV